MANIDEMEKAAERKRKRSSHRVTTTSRLAKEASKGARGLELVESE